jgi:hypothetical protein
MVSFSDSFLFVNLCFGVMELDNKSFGDFLAATHQCNIHVNHGFFKKTVRIWVILLRTLDDL